MLQNIPSQLPEELIDSLLATSSFTLERIVSKGHASPEEGWYDQDKDEWVLLLQGAARLAFDNGEEIELVAGDYIEISAHTRHKVTWTDPGQHSIWLALHFDSSPEVEKNNG
ncbi:MAG: cupin domain-containing protein [bacterium]